MARPLEDLVAWRGKKDLRKWGGPAAGTVTAILSGTWRYSTQTHGTFRKLDRAARWPEGTFWGWYFNHPSVRSYLDDDGVPRPSFALSDTPITTVLDNRLSEVPGTVLTRPPAPSENGNRLMDDELEAVYVFTDGLAQLLADLRGSLRPRPEKPDDQQS